MRQADSTIRGYLYQFMKSIIEILQMPDSNSLVLEGIIEDIDIISPNLSIVLLNSSLIFYLILSSLSSNEESVSNT